MKNKRTLKREIRDVCTALMAECEAARYYGKATDTDVQSLSVAVLRVYSDAVRSVSRRDPGMKASAYFRNLRESLAKQVDELVGQISALA